MQRAGRKRKKRSSDARAIEQWRRVPSRAAYAPAPLPDRAFLACCRPRSRSPPPLPKASVARLVSPLLQNLEEPRGAHAAAHAHGDHHVLGATPLSLQQRVPHLPRARHAEGVADGDCAAVDVHLVVVDA
eukprot:scaffold1735_cov119-Isochrysis_galbana.AAC.10